MSRSAQQLKRNKIFAKFVFARVGCRVIFTPLVRPTKPSHSNAPPPRLVPRTLENDTRPNGVECCLVARHLRFVHSVHKRTYRVNFLFISSMCDAGRDSRDLPACTPSVHTYVVRSSTTRANVRFRYFPAIEINTLQNATAVS